MVAQTLTPSDPTGGHWGRSLQLSGGAGGGASPGTIYLVLKLMFRRPLAEYSSTPFLEMPGTIGKVSGAINDLRDCLFNAIVIPIVKIVALGLGEFLRDSSNVNLCDLPSWA